MRYYFEFDNLLTLVDTKGVKFENINVNKCVTFFGDANRVAKLGEMFTAIKKQGNDICLLTSSNKKNTETILSQVGLLKYFIAVISVEMDKLKWILNNDTPVNVFLITSKDYSTDDVVDTEINDFSKLIKSDVKNVITFVSKSLTGNDISLILLLDALMKEFQKEVTKEVKVNEDACKFITMLLIKYGNMKSEMATNFVKMNENVITNLFDFRELDEDIEELQKRYSIIGVEAHRLCIMNFINSVHSVKRVINPHWISRIKAYIEKNNFLVKRLIDIGIFKHIKLNEKAQQSYEKIGSSYTLSPTFIKSSTMIFDSLLGLLKTTYSISLSFYISLNMYNNLMKGVELPLTDINYYESPINAFKEICSQVGWAKFHNESSNPMSLKNFEEKEENGVKSVTYFVYGFVLNDRSPNVRNKLLIASCTNTSKSKAENDACKKALQILNSYGIYSRSKGSPFEL